jgi:4-alpha-glucanotransferase
MLKQRSSGILMHITSVPSEFGIGDFGPATFRFVDFLKQAGQNCWQILPLNHTTVRTGHSPYNCFSAFAGNPLLISPVLLTGRVAAARRDCRLPSFPRRVDFSQVERHNEICSIDLSTVAGATQPATTNQSARSSRRGWSLSLVVAIRGITRATLGDWPAA